MSELYLAADGSLPAFPGIDASQNGIAPGYRIYEAGEGHVAVAALSDQSLGQLQRVAGVDDVDAIADALRSRNPETLLEELERTARRALGTAHPDAAGMGIALQNARATLRAREQTPSGGA